VRAKFLDWVKKVLSLIYVGIVPFIFVLDVGTVYTQGAAPVPVLEASPELCPFIAFINVCH